MKYKIDTRENFDIITPLYDDFDRILTEQLSELVDDSRENGRSLLLDLVNFSSLSEEEVKQIESFHHEMYNDNLSFVLCHLNAAVKQCVANLELEHVLNITPTIIEGVDIISMEGLERELLGGE